MKRVVLIEDRNKRSFFWEFLVRTFKSENSEITGKDELNEMLQKTAPDFVYLNLKEPVNGDEDQMNKLRYSDDLYRLRVTIITISIFSQIIDKIINFKSGFLSLFHIKKEGIIYKK